MTEPNKYSNSLEETLKDSDLQNVSAELAEVVLDNLIDTGIVRDIPIIGTIVGIGKVTLGIKERLFLKKIIYFLSEIKNISPSHRKNMVDGINNSGQFRTKVGEKLLFILDRCEDHEKAKLVAQMFSAFIEKNINYNEFLRSASIIDRIMLEDLAWFIKNDHEMFMFEELGDLLNVGLFSFAVEDQRNRDLKAPSGYELHAYISEIGSKMKYILKGS